MIAPDRGIIAHVASIHSIMETDRDIIPQIDSVHGIMTGIGTRE